MSDVSDKLAASRAEHSAYRSAKRFNQVSAAKTAMERALSLRLDADALDPDHGDPAWQAEELKYPHGPLVTFYLDQLSRM